MCLVFLGQGQSAKSEKYTCQNWQTPFKCRFIFTILICADLWLQIFDWTKSNSFHCLLATETPVLYVHLLPESKLMDFTGVLNSRFLLLLFYLGGYKYICDPDWILGLWTGFVGRPDRWGLVGLASYSLAIVPQKATPLVWVKWSDPYMLKKVKIVEKA